MNLISQIVILFLIIADFFTIFSQFSKFIYLADLVCNFSFQFFVIQLFSIIYIFFKNKKLFFISLICIFINLYQIFPFYYSHNHTTVKENKTLKILHMNVLTSNQQFQKVINLINNKQIDILLLNEINFKWINNLKPVLHKFKHKLEFPRSDNFGIGLYSNIPNIKSNLEFIDNFEIPVIKSEFSINNEHFSLLYLHLLPPGNFENFKFRNKQLDKISEYSKSLNKNKIIAGDFNLTSYSYFYKQFIKNSNLTDSRKGFGIQHSWPVGAPFFYTTLDHFFLSKNLKTVNRNTEDEIGSDHFPVYIEITY